MRNIIELFLKLGTHKTVVEKKFDYKRIKILHKRLETMPEHIRGVEVTRGMR